MILSLIIPAYNSGSIIRSTLDSLRSYMPDHFSSFEIIVVDDGSSDNTFNEASAFHDPHIKIIQHRSNQGKFAAIKTGMLSASGTCRIFTDADLPYEISAISYLAHLINDRQFHLAIGDRTLLESIDRAGKNRTRHLFSRSCRTAVRLLVAGEIYDTQCGLKAFRSDVANAIFPIMKEGGFAGDIEILYIALKYNLAIRRIPVKLLRSGQTSVRLGADSIRMLKRLILLRSAWQRGDYYSQELLQIGKQEY